MESAFTSAVRRFVAATDKVENTRELLEMIAHTPDTFLFETTKLMAGTLESIQIGATLMALAEKEQMFARVSPDLVDRCFSMVFNLMVENSSRERRTRSAICAAVASLASVNTPKTKLSQLGEQLMRFRKCLNGKPQADKEYGQSWYFVIKELVKRCYSDIDFYDEVKLIIEESSLSCIDSIVLSGFAELVGAAMKQYIRKWQIKRKDDLDYYMKIMEKLVAKQDNASLEAIRNCFRLFFIDLETNLRANHVKQLIAISGSINRTVEFIELWCEIFGEKFVSYPNIIKTAFRRHCPELVWHLIQNLMRRSGHVEQRNVAISSMDLLFLMSNHLSGTLLEVPIKRIMKDLSEFMPEHIALTTLQFLFGGSGQYTDIHSHVETALSICSDLNKKTSDEGYVAHFQEVFATSLKHLLTHNKRTFPLTPQLAEKLYCCLMETAMVTKSKTVIYEIEEVVPIIITKNGPSFQDGVSAKILQICECVLFNGMDTKNDQIRRKAFINILEALERVILIEDRDSCLKAMMQYEFNLAYFAKPNTYKAGEIAKAINFIYGEQLKPRNIVLANQLMVWCYNFAMQAKQEVFLTIIAKIVTGLDSLSFEQLSQLQLLCTVFEKENSTEGYILLKIAEFEKGNIGGAKILNFFEYFIKTVRTVAVPLDTKLACIRTLTQKLRVNPEPFKLHVHYLETNLIDIYKLVEMAARGKNPYGPDRYLFSLLHGIIQCLTLLARTFPIFYEDTSIRREMTNRFLNFLENNKTEQFEKINIWNYVLVQTTQNHRLIQSCYEFLISKFFSWRQRVALYERVGKEWLESRYPDKEHPCLFGLAVTCVLSHLKFE